MIGRRSLNEDGVTLVELLIGVVVMGIIAAGAMSMVQRQALAFSQGSAQMDALQNYRFAAELLERNIRTAGANTVTGQPFLIYADGNTVSFNADYMTNDTADMFAVYRNPNAPDTEVGALTRARRMVLPNTSFSYPEISYLDGIVNSPAETITFFFRPDSSTSRTDDYVLFRQVNDLDPETVTRGLLRNGNEPFFAYQELISGDTIIPRLEWVPAGALPLRHTVAVHLGPADTGPAARIDRVRAVRVSFTSVSGDREREQSSSMRRLIRMPNAGQRAIRTCGEDPLFTSSVSAGQDPGEERVTISWSPAFDEHSGEEDVVRYAIFRRVLPTSAWGEPYFSIPAGKASYVYTDVGVTAGATYQYAVAAQDCTPTMSGLRVSSLVTINPVP